MTDMHVLPGLNYAWLGIEPRESRKVGKHFTTELHAQFPTVCWKVEYAIRMDDRASRNVLCLKV